MARLVFFPGFLLEHLGAATSGCWEDSCQCQLSELRFPSVPTSWWRACPSPGCASLNIRKTPHLGILSWSGRLDAAQKSSEVQIVSCAVRFKFMMESGRASPVWQETWTWALIFSGTGVRKHAASHSTSFCLTLCFGLF